MGPRSAVFEECKMLGRDGKQAWLVSLETLELPPAMVGSHPFPSSIPCLDVRARVRM